MDETIFSWVTKKKFCAGVEQLHIAVFFHRKKIEEKKKRIEQLAASYIYLLQ